MNFPRHRTGFIVPTRENNTRREPPTGFAGPTTFHWQRYIVTVSTSRTDFLYNFTVTEKGGTATENGLTATENGLTATENGLTATEDKVYFCLSPCAGCKTRQGGCCSRLKIPELARGIFRRIQQPWLARDIASSTRGLFLFLSFPRETTETANTGVPGEQFPWVLKSFSRQQHFANQVLGRKNQVLGRKN